MRPSPRIFSRAGRRGADVPFSVDRNRHHAGRLESKILQLLPIELGVAEGKINVPDQRLQLLASDRGQSKQAGIVGSEERRGSDVVILQNASAAERCERLRHRRGERKMKDRDVATVRIRIAERAHISAKRIIHRQCEQI